MLLGLPHDALLITVKMVTCSSRGLGVQRMAQTPPIHLNAP